MPSIHLLHIPGMSGAGPLDAWFARGLRRSGLGEVEVVNWPKLGLNMLYNLRNRAQHGRAADELAGRVRSIRARSPESAVVVTAHSTGAMVTLEALERLGEPTVAQAWLLAAAVHRGRDLRPALAGLVAGTGRLCNVWSPRDVFLLGAGTAMFGNADGPRGESAGRTPFIGPGSDDDRVEQIQYDPRWAKSGHTGFHNTILFGTFAHGVLAPMIRQRLG